jgi:hypothetical protein
MKRLTTLVAAAALGAAVFVPAASADPTNAKKSLTFPATCDGTTLQVVVNGNGAFSPGHVVGSTAVFIPQSFELTFTFTPTGGAPQTNTASAAKPHQHGDLVTCSVDATLTSDEGTFRIAGTVTGFFTPASR